MVSSTIPLIEIELAKPWFAKRSPDLVRLYDQRRESGRLDHVRRAMVVLAVFYALNFGVDLIVIPDVWRIEAFNRFILAPIVTALVLWRSYRPTATAEGAERDFSLAIILAAVLHCVALSQTEHRVNAVAYFSANIAFFIAAAPFAGFEIRRAITSCSALAIILAATILSLEAVTTQLAAAGLCTLAWVPVMLVIIGGWLSRERYVAFLHAMRAELHRSVAETRNAELLRLSTTDALTGVMNRRSIDRAASEYLAAWFAAGRPFALFMIDVDWFKRFNDTYGHQAGDRCLVRVAEAMDAEFQLRNGVLGRFGGEEFIGIVQVPDLAAATEIGQAVQAAVAALRIPHEARIDQTAHVTISLGMTFTSPQTSRRVEDLISLADTALYQAKAAGRDRLCTEAKALPANATPPPAPPADGRLRLTA